MQLYFSRLTLARDPGTEALKDLIDPKHPGRRLDAHHRLLWTLFADGPDRTRDFLWRSEPGGRFYVLSERPPTPHGLFEAPETKVFEPALAEGDRLAFLLRANAVTQLPKDPDDKSAKGRVRTRKVDVAMHLLKELPGRKALLDGVASVRAPERHKRASQASRAWLDRQGSDNGFSVERFILDDYRAVELPREAGSGQLPGRDYAARIGVFDMKGELTVTDPSAFLAKLATGFGRAKAFGCGLMLIRRA